ncbi:protease SohB [Hahella sp. CCB-MM4]|uniref:protease SohB n=1 Tax=Hahella sp. (strain CCB-MM4) TaxID=1926491 RepID=UPI000B9B704D|nr:protease SohB [Hahella sp. CCB-MM4]OZG73632.1 protease SohB [Hahella sp. CCB-MM4]
MEFLTDYGLFLAKSVTLVVAILFVVGSLVALGQKQKKQHDGDIDITHLNDRLKKFKQALEDSILSKDLIKSQEKARKKKAKEEKKARKSKPVEELEDKARVFVLDFDGDIKASEVSRLREEITAVLTLAKDKDEVVIRLESPGGMVHGYGLAASQLERIRQKNIPLTVCVDKVAASGGYLMACLANKIVAAPFSIIGSIGVVAQLPNFHRLLKKHDIDFEVLTAGEYKRTLTVFGENTEKGRQKFVEDLEETHVLFKEFVNEHRPQVDIDEVSKGEIWYGRRALDRQLVDEIMTSDDYLASKCEESDVYLVHYLEKKSLAEKVGLSMAKVAETLALKVSKLSSNKV